MNFRRPISASASCGELVLLVLLVLGDPPEQHHADAGEQDRHAVDERPEPRMRGAAGWLNISVRSHIEPTPWVTTVNRTVQQERHPVLVERDEADDDEKWRRTRSFRW